MCWNRGGGTAEELRIVDVSELYYSAKPGRGCAAGRIVLHHCEPTGPARIGRPDDKLREAIQWRCFGS
jgi:hypothetical protein